MLPQNFHENPQLRKLHRRRRSREIARHLEERGNTRPSPEGPLSGGSRNVQDVIRSFLRLGGRPDNPAPGIL